MSGVLRQPPSRGQNKLTFLPAARVLLQPATLSSLTFFNCFCSGKGIGRVSYKYHKHFAILPQADKNTQGPLVCWAVVPNRQLQVLP